jgi:putative ABC transport system permease protein
MNSLRLVLRSVVHYRRSHAGLLVGTALAAAILSGALIVGDSVDHTLHTYAMQRLGKINLAVVSPDRMFSQQLGDSLQMELKTPVARVLALPGMAIYQNPESGKKIQVNKVQALGVEENFWSFGDGPAIQLDRREAALDQRLASALGVKTGDTVALRISKPDLLSRDAPLSSREEEASQRANFTVKAIVTDNQMGRFGLAASQLPPSNVFVSLSDLQQLSASQGQADLLLVGEGASLEVAEAAIAKSWKPEYSGLRVQQRGERTLQLESNRIFLDESTEKAALALPGAKGALTYLANSIQNDRYSTPYSFMTAGGPFTEGLGDDEIVVNAWLAEQLDTREGERVTITYFEVLPSNRFEERSREFTVKSVLSMEEFALEEELVPEFPGLSNVESCKDWKIGMPMDQKLLEDTPNEEYWDEYRDTPKALITLAAGQSMWSNRFGGLTAVRFDRGSTSSEQIMDGLSKNMGPRDVGLEVRAVRDDAAAAASQAMDLGGLFLGMSFFLLGSALMLTGLLYAFGAQQRAEEIGVLSALGYTRPRIRGIMLAEAMIVAIPGSILGAGFGLAYAWTLLIGLASAWQNAVGRIPVLFHARAESLAIGVIATIVCALIAAAFTLRRLFRHTTTELLNADFTQESRLRIPGRAGLIVAVIAVFAAAGLIAYGIVFPPADVAGLFFGSGFLTLSAGLLFARRLLTPSPMRRAVHPPTTPTLALLNATRRRGRSLGIVSSLAAGGFLVLAVSSMQSDVSANADKRWSGTGGFALYADATVPILNPEDLDKAAPGTKAHGIRVFDGDDASCLNLNHAIRPRVLGVDEKQFAGLNAFVEESDNELWKLLDSVRDDGTIPALVGDSDTAMWTLKKKTGPDGDVLTYRDEAGRDVPVKLVGRLPMRLSVFQGTILVSAKNFTKLWPSQEGFRVFLIDSSSSSQTDAIEKLQLAFDRFGLDVVPSTERLAMFHAVEGTYLSMFLVLGGIGLLLGASATGVVVLRNLLERRREIALLRALGFSSDAVFKLFAFEYGMLLVLGTIIGGIASIIAMLPAMTSSHSEGSPLWRLTVFAAVLGGALLCAGLALVAGLRKTGTAYLRAE